MLLRPGCLFLFLRSDHTIILGGVARAETRSPAFALLSAIVNENRRFASGAGLEDDVEVGAKTTIDRGPSGDTVIGAGSRLDNLVQIGNNVRIGRCRVVVAQVGIAGSTVLDDFVQVGGQAALAGHLHIERGAQSDVRAGEILVRTPAQPKRSFFKQVAVLKRLAQKRGTQPD
jgi:UDP-3-O-[3-hydroxymyristoyl] glucosamine N-acyltransferase LpxD